MVLCTKMNSENSTSEHTSTGKLFKNVLMQPCTHTFSSVASH